MSDVFNENFEVRDNEVDIQGIVSNDNYMVYLSHCRHKYVDSLGVDFNEYAKNNQKLVVISCSMNFKHSLKPRDKFYVTCKAVQKGSPFKFAYSQEIRLLNDDTLILTAEFVSTCINENAGPEEDKFYIPEEIKKLF